MNVTFASAAGQASGYLARAKAAPGAARAGVVVIQEWWGLVPHIRDVADRFAAAGFTALAPDLYHGKSTVEVEEAQHLMEGLDWGRAAGEIGGAVTYLGEQESVAKVGLVGYCMGGALTIVAAATQPGVDAYAAYYGFPPKGAAPLDRISAPGVIFFGENEGFFSIPDAQAFAAHQKQTGRQAEVIVYPKAGHAFFNDTRPEAYEKNAATDAWRRTLELFRTQLGAGR
jgi:carboxymethylenebutenolidase